MWRKLLDWLFGRKQIAPTPPPKPPKKKSKKKPTYKRCEVTDKLCRTEHGAKGRAAQYKIPKMRAYKCAFCGSWHLTHKKNKLTRH